MAKRLEEKRLRGRAHRLFAAACGLLLALTVLPAGGCFLIPNARPVAWIDVDRVQGVVPMTVRFDGTHSLDPDGAIRSYRWKFGDGAKAEGPIVEHTYTAPGTYRPSLTVTDRRLARSETSIAILVRETNEPPVVAFSVSPSSGQPDQVFWFDASASYDPDGYIESYTWDFGDGSTGSTYQVTHRYAAADIYEVRLTLLDNDGGERTSSQQLVIGEDVGSGQTLPRHYEWEYDGRLQTCDLDIPADLYAYYKTRPRVGWAARDYDEYVLDPLDDEYLEVVTETILETTLGDYHRSLENALFFVQECIRYVYDPFWYEYPRYPIELLVDSTGDCEDTAILYTSLVRTLGHGALMVVVDTDADGTVDHMVAWVPVEPSFVNAHPDRSFWDYRGQTYAFAETAVDGGYLPLGVDPWGLTEAQIDTIYDVSSADRHPQVVRRGPP